MISTKCISIDPKKVEVVVKCEISMTRIKHRSFLDVAGYYMRFAEGFYRIASPLVHLTQRNVTFELIEDFERNFQKLQRRLSSVPIIFISNGGEGFVVYTDVSRMEP